MAQVFWFPVKREWKRDQSYADLGLAKQLLKRSCLQFKTPPPMFVAAVDMLIPWTFSAHQLLYMWIWLVIMVSPLNLTGGFNVGSTSQLRLCSYSFILCCISSHGKSHEHQCLMADLLEFSSIFHLWISSWFSRLETHDPWWPGGWGDRHLAGYLHQWWPQSDPLQLLCSAFTGGLSIGCGSTRWKT